MQQHWVAQPTFDLPYSAARARVVDEGKPEAKKPTPQAAPLMPLLVTPLQPLKKAERVAQERVKVVKVAKKVARRLKDKAERRALLLLCGATVQRHQPVNPPADFLPKVELKQPPPKLVKRVARRPPVV